MPLYHVVSRIEHVHEIEADTPELAARWVEEGDGGQGEMVDGWVDRVVLPYEDGGYNATAEEARQPGWCPTHRQSIRPGSTCVGCLLGKPAA